MVLSNTFQFLLFPSIFVCAISISKFLSNCKVWGVLLRPFRLLTNIKHDPFFKLYFNCSAITNSSTTPQTYVADMIKPINDSFFIIHHKNLPVSSVPCKIHWTPSNTYVCRFIHFFT